MPLSVEQNCVEAAFVVALAVSTAALHYAHGFSPAFASLVSSEHAAAVAAAATNGPFYNYVCLLAAAAAAYAAARTAAAYAAAAALPKPSQGAAARRAALALCLPAVLLVWYVGAGYPRLGDTVVARWVAANWERNGERDLRWCGRLFALLACWQAVLAVAIAACRVLVGLVLLPWTSDEASSSSGRDSKSPSVSGKQEQEEGEARNDCGSSVREGKPRGAVSKDDRTQSSPEGRDGGAPGWEKEKTG